MWYDQPVFKGLSDELHERIRRAQAELTWLENASAVQLLGVAADRLRVSQVVLELVSDNESALDLGNRPHQELVELFDAFFPDGTTLAEDLADEVQLCRAFGDPTVVLELIKTRVSAAVSKFPRAADDIKVGDNKGDVLDPFILAANFEILSGQSLPQTIESTISHKILMKIEDLVGNMHEVVLGAMRGNFKVPEPGRTPGGSKDAIQPAFNPFPGADIGQVPVPSTPDAIRLFQCKNKTGSAKGGDGARLGQQLRRLGETYGAETFYAAIVGNTLVGHRSKGAVLRESPKTAVLVGEAALAELTRSDSGAELLLRTYRRAFRAVGQEASYDFQATVAATVSAFEAMAEDGGGDLVDAWLHQAMGGDRSAQDSREG
jgi:hypothetical protein